MAVAAVIGRCARRARYIARFIYWAVRHRSLRNVRWVLAFEGTTWDPDSMTNNKHASEEQLLADLAATYPGLDARPLREFTKQPHMQVGAWFYKRIDMPDGQPIYWIPFEVGHTEPEGYRGYIHDGFTAWLDARGWYIECYDYGTYLIVPLSPLEGQACGG